MQVQSHPQEDFDTTDLHFSQFGTVRNTEENLIKESHANHVEYHTC